MGAVRRRHQQVVIFQRDHGKDHVAHQRMAERMKDSLQQVHSVGLINTNNYEPMVSAIKMTLLAHALGSPWLALWVTLS